MKNDKWDGSSGFGYSSGNSQGSLHPADHLPVQNDAKGYYDKEQSSLESSPNNPQGRIVNQQNGNQLNNSQGNAAGEKSPGVNQYVPFIMALTALLIAATAFLMELRDFSHGDKKASAPSNEVSGETAGNQDDVSDGTAGKQDDSSDGTAGKQDDSSDEIAANQNEGGDDEEGPEGSSDGREETFTLILSQRDEFLNSLEQGAKEAAEELGVNLIIQDAAQDEGRQIKYIQDAAADGQKAVIVNPINPEACQSIVDAAGEMKVVFVNRIPDDVSLLDEDTAFVGSDESTAGTFQGDFLANYFKNKGQENINYILLRGSEGMISTTLRSESALQALADNGIIATETYAKNCYYDRTEAMNQMANILASLQEFDCIITNNDAMALGAIEACLQAGIDIDFPIVSIDASPEGRQAIKDGTLAMSVFQDPNGQGSGAVAAALNLINGAPLNENTYFDVDETGFILWVPFEEVTPDNVAEYDDR